MRFIRGILPDATWFLHRAAKHDGWIIFPPQFVEVYRNLKLEGYVRLYGDEKHIVCAVLVGLFGASAAKDLVQELAGMSGDEVVNGFLEYGEEVDRILEPINVFPKTPAERQEAQDRFSKLSKDEQQTAIRQGQFFWSGFLAVFYQFISVMVHGEKLTALVAQGIAGDPKAFAKAIQIDRNLLQFAPFKERMERAQFEGDSRFLDDVSSRMRNPVAKGKIRHRELWLAFSILEGMGLLDGSLSHGELLTLLDKSGVNLQHNRISDEKNLAKRLKDYRLFQARSKVSTP